MSQIPPKAGRVLGCVVTKRAPEVCRPAIQFMLKTCPDCQFLVVNNGGDAGQFTPQAFDNDSRVLFLHIPVNIGHPSGINFGIHFAATHGFDWFALIDDDVSFISEDWYPKCLQLMAFDPRIGCIAPKVLNPDEKTVQWGYTRITPNGWDFNMGTPREHDIVNRIWRACMVQCSLLFSRMEAIRRVGYFDVLFSPTQYGDADYSFRMWLAGYSCVYDGRIEIVHHFKAYQDKDDPMRQVYSMSHAYAIDLKYKGLMRFGLQLEEAIDRMGREITLPQGASPVRT